MKKQLALTTALAALFPLAATAQSPTPVLSTPAIQSIPATSPPPPVPPAPAPPAPGPRHFHERDNGPKEPVTFLGVETSDVPRVLSEQMGLPRGFGVVIDYVVPISPAAAAGLQQSDIIRLLNDQQIVNPGQLGKLVRSFADGTSVEFTIMRKGKDMKVSVKLAKKEMPAGRGPFGYEKEWNFDDLEKMKFDFKAPDMTAVREAVARAKDQAVRARDEAQRAVRGLRIVTSDDGLTRSTRIDLGRATITFSDDQGELKIENANGRKMLTAKDAKGTELYNGPIETPEDRAKLPENVRQRLEKLEREELPEAPEPPEPPDAPQAPQAPEANEAARLQSATYERAGMSPASRASWRRSTFVL
ncbi:MAG: PDZ domain-containing protein [Chthoniobacterales bacterium]|nr:PDZ domain-containing protein [Chthoniobacterales bacterium]